MAFSTVVWRPVNLLRSRETRASSKHTSTWGLARIYRARPELKEKIIENVTWRILTGRIRHWNRLPEEILSGSLKNIGLPLKGGTSSEMERVTALQNLYELAKESTYPKVLAILCENVENHIREAAAISPKTPWEAVAIALSKMPKENKIVFKSILQNHQDEKYLILKRYYQLT